MDEKLQDKLKELLRLTRECLELKEDTTVLSSELYEDFWGSMDAIEGDLTTLKSSCMI